MSYSSSDPTLSPYLPSIIEPKWQQYWETHQTFKAKRRPNKPKFYVLDMFPYPSGTGLHVGHPEGYTASDILARYRRMCDVDVLHPMGWDAFGLPAEQYAIQTGTHPKETTQKNIQVFKRQLKSLGLSFDWSREVNTTEAEYVRWTQWIFLQLVKRGLAYQDQVPVNWCPALGTVLANEEVIQGRSERGGHPVESIKLRQWMLRITAYADQLDEALDALDWPDTKLKQRHWIGRSQGVTITFQVEGYPMPLTVFTTRPETLPGVTYLAIAPDHPFASTLAGAFAIHPLDGARIPITVADYVIGSYGSGAVMGVPAHDERDHAFAQKHGWPIRQVIAPLTGESVDVFQAPFCEGGVVYHFPPQLEKLNGIPVLQAREQITQWLINHGFGKQYTSYRMRDWIFSRQRYWGEPIPIYFPVTCDGDPRQEGNEYRIDFNIPIPVQKEDLPVLLPDLDDFRPSRDPAGPLARALNWRFFQKDGAWFARETNTMPQWAGSCWYYLRFLDPSNRHKPFDQQAYDAWMPVDLYIGGSEHAVLHLLYARFWHKVLYDIGLVHHPEPFLKLVHQGTILGENGEKMSKSRGNVINPDDIIAAYGADTLRMHEMFMGPLEQVKPWQTGSIEGIRRFLERIWTVCTGPLSDDPIHQHQALEKQIHKTIHKVTHDLEALRFNTAISALMILVKSIYHLPTVPKEAARILTLLISPFAPHLGEELWERLGGTTTLSYEPWPTYDPALIQEDTLSIGVQINGRLRGSIQIPVSASEEEAREMALLEPKIRGYVEGKSIQRLVYIPGKIINLIVP
ncbi:leucine--tRNA ligase [Pajaroellobacter abortibovis]|uniref:Leucine--tRNA ligase n=1 Tax=Pajaroellobacter abortibovis TaxID=1882918 RepID=A0A1L6MZE2_9BACT|nr:class I tRNA ligase family protein [Pajaroellobacter abortibovis]APS00896.1 leucine--tRNA ligase [Pajaroellobacter abortibovis]